MKVEKITALLIVVLLSSIASASVETGRQHTFYPTGLQGADRHRYWHLSEGDEFFPIAWAYHMKSTQSLQDGTTLMDHLDQKFGVNRDDQAVENGYPLPWVGLSASWGDGDPSARDVVLQPNDDVNAIINSPYQVNGAAAKNVAMLGFNCAFCHTATMTINDRGYVIDGAPGLVNAKAFLADFTSSAITTMLDPELLQTLLQEMNPKLNAASEAWDFSSDFFARLGLQMPNQFLSDIIQYLGQHLAGIPILGPAINQEIQNTQAQIIVAVASHPDVVLDKLVDLLKLTYALDEVSPTDRARLALLPALASAEPINEGVYHGYGRADAFGRARQALSGQSVTLDDPTSVPPIWETQYRALFQWNGNTNSPLVRNSLQAVATGAPFTVAGGSITSAINLHDITKLETLLGNVQVPNWVALTGETIAKADVQRGCQIYATTCYGCHSQPQETRVGPTASLIFEKTFALADVGTDPQHAQKMAAPIGGQPFHTLSYQIYSGIRDWYFQRYAVPADVQTDWLAISMRGPEFIRDAYYGESDLTGVDAYANTPVGTGYVARSLAGIWASAPFLHNGSVPTLYDLLLPVEKRPKVFFVKNQNYNGKKLGYFSKYPNDWNGQNQGSIRDACDARPEECIDIDATVTEPSGLVVHMNSNVGHSGTAFGTTLGETDRLALVQFMKVLKPQPEFSWTQSPFNYDLSAGSCTVH